MPSWSPQQDAALLAVSAWLKDKDGPQVFRLVGWAGTGKSTLARYLAEGVRGVKYAAFTLEPGDLIFTGTPAGVGNFRNPPVYLKAGDVVRIEIDRLGILENKCVAERGETVIV